MLQNLESGVFRLPPKLEIILYYLGSNAVAALPSVVRRGFVKARYQLAIQPHIVLLSDTHHRYLIAAGIGVSNSKLDTI